MPASSQANLDRRAFLADTAALLLFFTTTGAINEYFIAGMAPAQVLRARLLVGLGLTRFRGRSVDLFG